MASVGRIDDFLATLHREIVQRAAGEQVHTIYFGGGTPSVLSVDQIGGILSTIRSVFNCSSVAEITLEANPEQLSAPFLDGLGGLGVNRLSIGIQSFDDNHLRTMSRRHTAAEAVAAVKSAQNAGFGNISVDLIYGLPFMTIPQWKHNVEMVAGLGVQHISAYHLTIEPRTAFAVRGMEPVADSVSEVHYNILCGGLGSAGFEHYEISNFALPTHRSLHNSAYWNSTPYLGFGASAHSYNGGRVRRWNVSNLNKYIAFADYFDSETLTDADIHNEFIMTRLRTADGFLVREYFEKFGREFTNAAGLSVADGRVFIAPEKWLVSDSIISALFI